MKGWKYLMVECAALVPVAVAISAFTDLLWWQALLVFVGIGVYAGVSSRVDRWRERDRWRQAWERAAAARPSVWDAGHVTVGQALGVALLTVAFLAAMALVGAVETAGLS